MSLFCNACHHDLSIHKGFGGPCWKDNCDCQDFGGVVDYHEWPPPFEPKPVSEIYNDWLEASKARHWWQFWKPKPKIANYPEAADSGYMNGERFDAFALCEMNGYKQSRPIRLHETKMIPTHIKFTGAVLWDGTQWESGEIIPLINGAEAEFPCEAEVGDYIGFRIRKRTMDPPEDGSE